MRGRLRHRGWAARLGASGLALLVAAQATAASAWAAPAPAPEQPRAASEVPLEPIAAPSTPEPSSPSKPESAAPAAPAQADAEAPPPELPEPAPAPAAAATEPAPAPAEAKAKPLINFTPRAQYWIRGTSRLNSKFSPDPGDRVSAVAQRVRLGVLAETGPVRVYGEFQDVRVWGFESSTVSNEANADLHQGYLEFHKEGPRARGSLTIGRQEIVFGSRRLFVDRPWAPAGQSFDGVRAQGALGKFGFDAAAIMLAPPTDFTLADPGGDPALDQKIHTRGSYTGYVQLYANLHEAVNVEGLVLGISERPTAAKPTIERDILNSGLRIFGKPLPGLSYDLEAYGQTGRNLGLRHRAFAGMGTVTYTFPVRLEPGLSLRYNYATGDACTGTPADGCGNTQSREFYRFFGLQHARYGVADLAALSNLRSLEATAHLRPHETLNLDLTYQFLQLDQPTGAWRDVTTRLVGAGWDPTNQDRSLAHELDFVATYRPLKQLFIQPAYALVVPLGGGQALAGSEPQHLLYLWMIAKY